MAQENSHFIVTSNANSSLCNDVCTTINKLGYPVDLMKYDAWLNSGVAESRQNLILLLQDHGKGGLGSIVNTLGRQSGNALFGIFDLKDDTYLPALLQHCQDFITWPGSMRELAVRLSRFRTSEYATPPLSSEGSFIGDNRMVGQSPAFLSVMKKIKRISACDAPVLIEGETGTGKEMVARAIHYKSFRKGHPFIPVNCGALPDDLLENELFGHEKGAFTDARNTYDGLIHQAEGGSLFLDEIEALSVKAQVALLRFLQSAEYRSLGGKSYHRANVRIISASNASLNLLVEEGKFREDLYFRLNVVPMEVPPLRQRQGDIELLIAYFWDKYSSLYSCKNKRLTNKSYEWLQQYHWPGNIRELENLLHREFLLAENDSVEISPAGFHAKGRHNEKIFADNDNHLIDFNTAKNAIITDFERHYLNDLMLKCRGNVTMAAKCAAKERRAFGKLLKKHGIERSQYV